MRTPIALLLGALVAGIGSVAHAQEAETAKAAMSGMWEVAWETPRGPMTMKMELGSQSS